MPERFADTYEARSPAAAEAMAVADQPGLVVAGVINSEGQVVA